MKTSFIKLSTFILVASFVSFTSCKKEGCMDEKATNYDEKAKKSDGSCIYPEPEEEIKEAEEPENPTPQPSDADAVLIAIQTVSYTESFGTVLETPIGLPVALVLDGTNLKDVGAVTCESKALTKQNNNSYVFMPTSTDYSVDYSGDIDWSIEGGNGFPALTKASDPTFPSEVNLTTSTGGTVSLSSDFTLETKAPISNADSVIFAVYGPDNSLLVTKVGTEYSHTFTASQMESVGAGTGFVQVTAYKYAEQETLTGGEKVYYINEKVNTTSVTFE